MKMSRVILQNDQRTYTLNYYKIYDLSVQLGPKFMDPPIQSPSLWTNPSSLTRYVDTYEFIDPYRFRDKLSDSVVLITSADRGIGRSTALSFALAGASVACVGPSTAAAHTALNNLMSEIREKYKTPAIAIRADLANPKVPANIVNMVETELGPIDILVNVQSSGRMGVFALDKDFMEDWWRVMELNFRIPVSLIHAVLPGMIKRGKGTVISTTFVSAIVNVPFNTAYSSAKAALIKFHEGLDHEINSKGVCSYVVHPGHVASHMNDTDTRFSPEQVEEEPRLREEVLGQIGEGIQWQAAGLAAGTFVTLAADERARCLSGRYVDAERNLEAVIEGFERDRKRVDDERLYVLKIDEF